MSYHLTYAPDGSPVIVRDADGATIPQDPRNTDWRAFLLWNAAQATPLAPATPKPPGAISVADQLDALGVSGRLLAALTFRLSASWIAATPAQQQLAQALLDAMGAKVLKVIS